jgi:hypothetical protein
VHDLHVWSVTPGFEALAGHVVVARDRDRDLARREVEFLLRERYGIEHSERSRQPALASENTSSSVAPENAFAAAISDC